MSARDYALSQLDAIPLPGWKPRLARRHVAAPADPRDLALAEQLRVGVIKQLLLLQALIAHHSARPLAKVDPLVQKVLAIGLYQLRFLQKVPPSAAVDEAVEQVRRFGRPGAAGFVNAVLRNATRNGDPAELPPEVLWSHPAELLARYRELGMRDAEIQEQCRHNNAEPPTIVRLFPGRSAADLAAEGVTVTPHEATGCLVVTGARQANYADWAARGIAQVQDVTAAGVVPILRVGPGMTVLDRCCGVGTKTIQLAEAVTSSGRVFAIDPSIARTEILRRSLAQREITHVGVIEAGWVRDARQGLPQAFDRVLVDAPCSNSGVLPRRPEAKYHQSVGLIESLAKLQTEILADTAGIVAPGGLLAYSTCSVWPEENQGVVSGFLSQFKKFDLETEQVTAPASTGGPAGYRDGGYVALLKRRG